MKIFYFLLCLAIGLGFGTSEAVSKINACVEPSGAKVRINGVTDLDTVLDIKGLLQSIVWVSEVAEKQKLSGKNALTGQQRIKQKGNFKVVNFSPYSLTLDYQKESK